MDILKIGAEYIQKHENGKTYKIKIFDLNGDDVIYVRDKDSERSFRSMSIENFQKDCTLIDKGDQNVYHD